MRKEVEIKDKILLTIEEAAAYSNIGENKLRQMVEERNCDYILHKGKCTLIKRVKFEKYLLSQEII